VTAPYESLAALALRERELLADGRLDEVAQLAQRFDELAATLPDTPPEGARQALEATERALVSSVAQLEAGLASVRVELARMLRGLEGTNPVRVEGNTDNVPIFTARFRNNWELSAARAVTVLTVLDEDGFDPKRLSAAG
jgi:flagellar motor protein MotB